MPAELEFVRGSILEQDVTAEFESIITQDPELAAGTVFYGYPLWKPDKDRPTMSPDAVVIAPNGQVTIVHMSPAPLAPNYREHQDDCYNSVYRKLSVNKAMRNRRELRVKLQTISFIPDLPESDLSDPDYPVVNRQELAGFLRDLRQQGADGLSREDVVNAIMLTNSDTGFW